MNKLFISLSILILTAISASAQSTTEEVVLVSFEQMSASKAGLINRLTYGKSAGFDQTENAFVVKPADATKETLDKLVDEIKYKSPDCIVKVKTTEKKVVAPTATQGK